MNTKHLIVTFLGFLLSFLISSCGALSQTATQTFTSASTPNIFTPIRTTTSAPTPTITLTPTSTSTSTPFPTSTPTLSPTPAPTLIGGGEKIILNLREKSNNIAGGSVYLYDLQTGETTLMLEEYQCLAISPDEDKLVLMQSDYQNNKAALYTSDMDGSNLILLHEIIYWSESVWLPDTDWISFLSIGDNDKIQVFIVHPDGTGLKQLTRSTIGAGKIVSYFDGGVYWEEALVTSSGTWSHGFRRTTIDGSETKTVEEPISKIMPDTVPSYIVNSNFYLDQFYWERGEWSPDGRLYAYFKVVNFIAYKGGDNILMIFNNDTKQVDEWDLNIPEGLEPSGIFWLTNQYP